MTRNFLNAKIRSGPCSRQTQKKKLLTTMINGLKPSLKHSWRWLHFCSANFPSVVLVHPYVNNFRMLIFGKGNILYVKNVTFMLCILIFYQMAKRRFWWNFKINCLWRHLFQIWTKLWLASKSEWADQY